VVKDTKVITTAEAMLDNYPCFRAWRAHQRLTETVWERMCRRRAEIQRIAERVRDRRRRDNATYPSEYLAGRRTLNTALQRTTGLRREVTVRYHHREASRAD
jgi:hypothetical protein